MKSVLFWIRHAALLPPSKRENRSDRQHGRYNDGLQITEKWKETDYSRDTRGMCKCARCRWLIYTGWAVRTKQGKSVAKRKDKVCQQAKTNKSLFGVARACMTKVRSKEQQQNIAFGRGHWAVRLGRRGWQPGRARQKNKEREKGGVAEEKGERRKVRRSRSEYLNVESLLCGVRAALRRGRGSGIGNGNGQGHINFFCAE